MEPHNLLRQNFYAGDVGEYKSQTLATRLARNYRREIRYCTTKFEFSPYANCQSYPGSGRLNADIVVGCVDNSAARQSLQQACISHDPKWWIDAGNGRDWGQILIGNQNQSQGMTCSFEDGFVTRLPDPVTQRPDLLTTISEDPPDLDCAAALDLTDQDPTINQLMASFTVHTIRRILAGSCNYMALYLDLPRGTVNPQYATPENAARPFAMNPEVLLAQHDQIQGRRCRRCQRYINPRAS